MKPMPCPKCGGKLETVTYQEIEVDRCGKCAGIWFDCLEAEKLKAIQGSESLDLGNPEIQSQLDRLPKEIKCPKCKRAMIRMLDIDQYMIWYEKCPKCHGVWLDAGEFRRYKQNFQSRGLLDRALQAFHHAKG